MLDPTGIPVKTPRRRESVALGHEPPRLDRRVIVVRSLRRFASCSDALRAHRPNERCTTAQCGCRSPSATNCARGKHTSSCFAKPRFPAMVCIRHFSKKAVVPQCDGRKSGHSCHSDCEGNFDRRPKLARGLYLLGVIAMTIAQDRCVRRNPTRRLSRHQGHQHRRNRYRRYRMRHLLDRNRRRWPRASHRRSAIRRSAHRRS
jgi:hypothetical protein